MDNVTLLKSEEYIRVVAKTDDASHWYLIPAEFEPLFDELMNKYLSDEDEGVAEQFENMFGEYRTGGDLNLVKLYIKL